MPKGLTRVDCRPRRRNEHRRNSNAAGPSLGRINCLVALELGGKEQRCT